MLRTKKACEVFTKVKKTFLLRGYSRRYPRYSTMPMPLDTNQNQSILGHLPTEKTINGGRNAIVLPPLGEPSRILDKPTCSSGRPSARSDDADRHHHHVNGGSKQQIHRIRSISSGSAGSLQGADRTIMPQGEEERGSLRDNIAIAEKETETEPGGSADDTAAGCTAAAATTTVPSIVEHNGNADTDNNGTQLSPLPHDTRPGRPEEAGTDPCGDHESVHSGGVGSTDDATNDCSIDNREGGPTREDARATLAVDAPTTACVSTPTTGEAANNPSGGKNGGASPFSPSSIRARVGGLRNRLTLGWEAQASPGCPPRPAAPQESSNQQQQPIARGRPPLSWLQLGRSKESGRGKVSPIPFQQAPDVNSSKTAIDHGVDEAAAAAAAGGRPIQVPVECSSGGHHDRFSQGGDGKDTIMAGRKETHDGSAKKQPRPIDGGGSDSNEVEGGAATVGTLNGATFDKDTDATPTGKAADEDNAATVAGSNSDATKQDGQATRKVLARNMTLVDRDVWPAVLENEADPAEWALDKGESEVLAAARSLGSILVRVVTWNLHAKPTPAAEKLRETLLPPGKFHIFAVGTEECQNSIAKSVIVHSKKEWEGLLKATLGASYEMLCGHGLQATHNAVFAHRAIVPLLRNVRSSAVPTGLSLGAPGTTLGNKGGVGIAFSIGVTSCVFVNSHLAAHQTNVRERNDHFFQISHGLMRALRPAGSVPPRGNAQRSGENEDNVPSSCPTTSPPSSAVVTPCDRAGGGGGGGADETVAISFRPSDSRAEGNNNDGQICCAGEQVDLERTLLSTSRAPDDVVGTAVTTTNRTCLPGHTTTESQQKQPSTAGNSDRSKLAVTKLDSASLPSKEDDNADSATPPLSPDPRAAVQCPPSPADRHGGGGGGSTSLPEVFDRVIWAGDLNYRINAPRAVANLLLAKDMHEVLLKNEQLTLERKKGGGGYLPPFAGYREGPLNFRPTYKFDSGTNTYDSSSKQRVPAWTDRVLFSVGAESQTTTVEEDSKAAAAAAAGEGGARGTAHGLKLRSYRSVEELKTSDHRPVIASFVMEFDQREGGGGDDNGSEGAAVTNQTSSEVCSLM